MPWDGCELWVDERRVAGGPDESIWQPEWSPAGELHWVSDRSGWWNLYREGGQLTDERAELGYPQWLFGGSTYAFLEDGTIACVRIERAVERLCLLRDGRLDGRRTSPTRPSAIPVLRARGDRLIFVAAEPGAGAGGGELERGGRRDACCAGERRAARPSASSRSRARSSSRAPAAARRTPSTTRPPTPTSREPPDERPPLIVQIHGGPTAHAAPELDPEIAVLDQPRLRRGRRQLRRQHRVRPRVPRPAATAPGASSTWRTASPRRATWRARARWTAAAGHPRRQRRRLHHALRARVPPDVFAAGASYYGVADAETLAARHAQVRVALPRRPDRALSRGGGDATASARRSTSPTASACP